MDIVKDIMQRIADQFGAGLSADALRRIETEVRRDWGGDRPYIARTGESARAAFSARNAAIARDWRHGESITLIARRYGISRKRVYQILAERRCEGFALPA